MQNVVYNLYIYDWQDIFRFLCHLERFSRVKEHNNVICIVSEPNWISYQVYRFSIRGDVHTQIATHNVEPTLLWKPPPPYSITSNVAIKNFHKNYIYIYKYKKYKPHSLCIQSHLKFKLQTKWNKINLQTDLKPLWIFDIYTNKTARFCVYFDHVFG